MFPSVVVQVPLPTMSGVASMTVMWSGSSLLLGGLAAGLALCLISAVVSALRSERASRRRRARVVPLRPISRVMPV